MHCFRALRVTAGVALLAFTSCSSPVERAAALDLARAAERSFSPFEGSEESVRLRDAARDTLSGFAARDLYDTLAVGSRDRAPRGILIRLEGAEGARTLTHERKHPDLGLFAESPARMPQPGPSLGDALLFVALQPLGTSDVVLRLRVASAIRTGRGDAFAVPRGIPPVLEQIEAAAREGEPGPLLALFRKALPKTAAAFERHLELRDGTAWSEEEKRLRVHPRIVVRREALAAEHPHFAAWLERIGEALRNETLIETRPGTTVTTWRWDGLEKGFSLRLESRGGSLLPVTGEGEPVDLRAPTRLTMVSSGSMELFGLRTTVEGIDAAVEIDPRRESPTMRMEMAGLPAAVTVEGRLFGIVPSYLVDLLMPGTLASSIRESMRTSFLGRDGEGILVLASSEGEGESHFASTSLFADVPAGSFTQLARRWVASATRPTPEEWSDFRRWVESLARAFRTDLAGTAPTRQLAAPR